ncbi:hypothetical protein QR680_000251 [Steinernema hermaphroditum]|uniref:PAS domain-containing protein n=1 Tax=Steinernema hermaphroditum TaxID=289476 RepID=A0AA39GW04_9BILA|nr:hypothetical protein QR680_000251 [Steinernema hermaphroditum]
MARGKIVRSLRDFSHKSAASEMELINSSLFHQPTDVHFTSSPLLKRYSCSSGFLTTVMSAASRRDLERQEFENLNKLLPISEAVSATLDKVSIVRIAAAYLALHEFLSDLDMKRDQPLDLTKPYLKDLPSYILQTLDGFVLLVDLSGRIIYASETASVHLGVSQADIMGCSLFPFVHVDDARELQRLLLDCQSYYDLTKSGVEIRYTIRMRCTLSKRNAGITRQGYKTIHFWSQTLSTKTTNRMALIGLGTTLVQGGGCLETKLSSTMFMFRATKDLKIVFIDARVTEITGYNPANVLDHTLYQFVHPDDSTQLLHTHKTATKKQQSVTSYFRLLARGGGHIWVQCQFSLVPLIKLPMDCCILGIVTSISERMGSVVEDALQKTPLIPKRPEMVLGEYSNSFYTNPVMRFA